MEGHGREIFYLPNRTLLSACFVALFGSVIYFALRAGAYEHVLLAVVNLGVTLLGIWSISALSISENALVLYRVNRLKWEDVIGARRVRFLGLPHILIKRRKGISWWLPLYFRGARSIEESIKHKVPQGNPVREAVRGR